MKNPTLEYDLAGDEDLMEELVNQHPEALQQLYRRHYKVLDSVVMQVLHDHTDAEEVLQDVFVHLWTQADKYAVEKGKPLGWLITLARRRAIDRVRRRSAYRRATERLEWQVQHEKTATFEDKTIDHDADLADLRHYLAKLVDRLPPFQREAIEQAFFRGMSQREIAAQTHLPLGTVKTRIELGLREADGGDGGLSGKIE